VTTRLHLSRGALPRAMLLALIAALVPLPVGAADTPKAPAEKAPSLREAVTKIAPRDLAAIEATDGAKKMTRPAVRRSDQSGNPATQSGSFFRTTPGIVVLATLAVGVGYALYSTQNDRVSSPGRK